MPLSLYGVGINNALDRFFFENILKTPTQRHLENSQDSFAKFSICKYQLGNSFKFV